MLRGQILINFQTVIGFQVLNLITGCQRTPVKESRDANITMCMAYPGCGTKVTQSEDDMRPL
ncbi:MAG: hypothetical protein KDD59_14075, partial [Bdellovibrionales bacterium]|nr:hypothetical protein [Bdellovibrionales bacterium]